MSIDVLYPTVEFPVSRGTPMISPMISMGWNHSENWFVANLDESKKSCKAEHIFDITLSDEEYQTAVGHQINGEFLNL